MGFPNNTTYHQAQNGFWFKQSDNSGPYVWDGTSMTLVNAISAAASPGLPASLGQKTAANSTSVVLSSDGPFAANFGVLADAAATASTDAVSHMSFMKGLFAKLVAIIAQLPASLGIKTAANSLSVAPASDANVTRETYTTVTITSVQTNASGATFTAFGSLACTQLDIVNNTGTTIEYRRGATGTAFQIPDGSSRLIQGITNANQIDVRRTDVSNTQVTAYAEGYAV